MMNLMEVTIEYSRGTIWTCLPPGWVGRGGRMKSKQREDTSSRKGANIPRYENVPSVLLRTLRTKGSRNT